MPNTQIPVTKPKNYQLLVARQLCSTSQVIRGTLNNFGLVTLADLVERTVREYADNNKPVKRVSLHWKAQFYFEFPFSSLLFYPLLFEKKRSRKSLTVRGWYWRHTRSDFLRLFT